MRLARHTIAACLMALACAGAGFGAAPADAANPPRPGRLIKVAGHAMYIHCTGAGSPTVVLASGLGDSTDVWARVQPRLARLTRVCSYDRAGYGPSAPVPGLRTSAVITT